MTKRQQDNNNETHGSGSLSSGKEISSPGNLSFEMIDESVEDMPPPMTAPPAPTNGFTFEKFARNRESYLYSLPTENFSKLTAFMDGPNSTSENEDHYLDNYDNDLDYYPMKSSPGSNNVVEPEREDFPVNSADPPDYAPKMHIMSATTSKASNIKTKLKTHAQRRQSPPLGIRPFGQPRKLSAVSSISTIDLHNIDDSMATTATSSLAAAKKSLAASRNGSPTRNYTAFNNNNGRIKRTEVKEVNHARNNRKITVQIMTPKPPTRSKTTFELRSSSSAMPTPSSGPSSTIVHPANRPPPSQRFSQNLGSSAAADESSEINVMTAYHERVYHELCNRYATLQLIRNPARYGIWKFLEPIFRLPIERQLIIT